MPKLYTFHNWTDLQEELATHMGIHNPPRPEEPEKKRSRRIDEAYYVIVETSSGYSRQGASAHNDKGEHSSLELSNRDGTMIRLWRNVTMDGRGNAQDHWYMELYTKEEVEQRKTEEQTHGSK